MLASPGIADWIFPYEKEQLELDDFNSDGSLFGQISVPVMELLTSKLHFLLEETCCYLCCLSYMLFRAIWKHESLREILPFVDENRVKNLARQQDTLNDIMAEMEKMGVAPSEFDVSMFKAAVKRLNSASTVQHQKKMTDVVPNVQTAATTITEKKGSPKKFR